MARSLRFMVLVGILITSVIVNDASSTTVQCSDPTTDAHLCDECYTGGSPYFKKCMNAPTQFGMCDLPNYNNQPHACEYQWQNCGGDMHSYLNETECMSSGEPVQTASCTRQYRNAWSSAGGTDCDEPWE